VQPISYSEGATRKPMAGRGDKTGDSPDRFFAFEVIEPTDPRSSLSRFLEQHGEGIHHISFEIEDLPYLIKSLKTEGVAVIETDNKAAFIHPKSFKGVLAQLYETGSQF
jgi:hypothetical protein